MLRSARTDGHLRVRLLLDSARQAQAAIEKVRAASAAVERAARSPIW